MRTLLRTGLVTLAATLAVAVGAPTASAAPGSPTPTPRARAYVASAPLDGRTARTLSNHAAPDHYPAGSSVLVVCQAKGGATYDGSRIWDLTADGLWVPDPFVATGTDGFADELPQCELPRSFVATRTLDGRTEKRLGNHARPDRYRRGDTVEVTCQAFGGPAYHGSSLWDRTTEGLWVPDYFVRTGSNGPVPGLPLCDVDPPAGGRASASGTRHDSSDLQLSSRGAAFIAAYEGYRGSVYEDAGGHCTIGYGHLLHLGRCTRADADRWGTLSRDRALALLWEDAGTYAAGVREALPDTELSQAQFDALVSLSYNIGNGGFRSSSVREVLDQDRPDYAAVPDKLMRWVSSGGVKLPGLQRRRANEGRLFTTGLYEILRAGPYSAS